MVASSLAWAFGRADAVPATPVPRKAVAIRFFSPAPGRVRWIHGLDEVRANPAVVDVLLQVEPGSRVDEVRSSRDRSGYLIAQGPTSRAALDLCRQLANRVQIVTTPE